jgi:hypothetical protein
MNNTIDTINALDLTNGAEWLNTIIDKAQSNSSRKVTISADELQAQLSRQEKLEQEIARLQALTVVRPKGRPTTKTEVEPIDLRAMKSTNWFTVGENQIQFENIPQAMKEYGIDWTVSTTPCGNFWRDEWQEIEGRYNVTRDTDGFAFRQVSDRFGALQNSEVFAICQDLINDAGFKFAKFGIFDGGAVIYCTLDAGDYEIAGSLHKSRFTISLSHTGIQSVRCGIGDLVQVCTNGMMKWKEVKIKQTTNSLSRLDEVKALIMSSVKEGSTLRKDMERFASQKINNDVAKRILLKSLGINNVDSFDIENKEVAENQQKLSAQQITAGKELLKLYFDNISDVPDSVRDTAYGVLQATTYRNTHMPTTKQDKSETSESALFRSQAFGAGNKHTSLVMELLQKNTEYKEVSLVQPVHFVQ